MSTIMVILSFYSSLRERRNLWLIFLIPNIQEIDPEIILAIISLQGQYAIKINQLGFVKCCNSG